MAREFGETSGHFGVFVENPGKIYSIIRTDMIAGRGYRNITALMRDPLRHSGDYSISSTSLSSQLVEREETGLTIETEMGPYCYIDSKLFLNNDSLANPPYGFFVRTQRGEIRQRLMAQGIGAEWDKHFSNLQIKRLNEVVVDINFGWDSPLEKISSLTRMTHYHTSILERLKELGAPQAIIEAEEARAMKAGIELLMQMQEPTNDVISIRLSDIWKRDGGKGGTTVSFRNPDVFAENLRYYARVYESLIKVVHDSFRLPEPQEPIIFSPQSIKKNDPFNQAFH